MPPGCRIIVIVADCSIRVFQSFTKIVVGSGKQEVRLMVYILRMCLHVQMHVYRLVMCSYYFVRL